MKAKRRRGGRLLLGVAAGVLLGLCYSLVSRAVGSS